MRVAIVGGTGFVGGYLVEALLEAGHEVRALVRPGSESKLRASQSVATVSGDLSSMQALQDLVGGCDAVIYNVGLLREFPGKGITFEQAQYRGVVDTIEAMQGAGVERLLLMSAIGVKDPGTRYQSTKYRAERHALASDRDVTVLRPSVIFGDPRGTMEFATQLCKDMVRPPLPAVDFGNVGMSPVFVGDVADAFVAALENDDTIGEVIELAGPEALSWNEIVARVAAGAGKEKFMLPVPISLMRIGAALFDWLPFFPVTRDQLTMLAEGSTAPPDGLRRLIGREPQPMTARALEYLAA
jgi:uncharacterized protein YbjT (DUF2867 family)